MRIAPRFFRQLAAICLIVAPAVTCRAADDQPLQVTPKLIGQEYCYGDAEVYAVRLTLRMKYINGTDKTLILDKEIGVAWYGVAVARNTEDLNAGKYEYHPNIDWMTSGPPNVPSPHSPGPDFVILAPGRSFTNEIDATVVAQYDGPSDFAGSIRSGTHMLRLDLSSWNHSGEASKFEESWRRYGRLVTGVIKSEPLEIVVPSNPKVKKKCG